MKTHTLSKIHFLLCISLLVIAPSASAQRHVTPPSLSQQCGETFDPLVDAATKHYLVGLVALGGTHATWGDPLCKEASGAKAGDGMHRLKAVLGAHLLHQAATRDTFSPAQRKAMSQAIDRPKVLTASRDRTLELLYVDVRSNAALVNVSAEGLAYDLRDKSPAVAKTLGECAERWEP